MSSQQNLNTVKAYFDGLASADRDAIAALLADDAVEIVPLSNSGDPDPWNVFTGKDEVMGYVDTIVENFSQVLFTDPVYTVSDDGEVVFFEAHGDLVVRMSSQPYHNVYIVKFSFQDGRIVHISEYANPITISKAMGLPIG